MAVPPSVPRRTQQVVQRQAAAIERSGQDVAVQRKQQRLEADEVRREAEEPAALGERLAHEPEPELLQVAQPAVDEARGATGRAGGDVGPLDERDAEASARRIQGGTAI